MTKTFTTTIDVGMDKTGESPKAVNSSFHSLGLVQRRQEHTESPHANTVHMDHEMHSSLLQHGDVNDEEYLKKYNVENWTRMDPKQYKRRSKSIRRFYDQQNDLIDRLLQFYQVVPTSEESDNHVDESSIHPAAVTWAINASFLFNILLLAIKIIASALSGSMSVIASAADSLLDLLSGSVLVITHRLIKKKDVFRYPQGRSRMEPIGVFAFSIVMMLSSLQILIEAVRRLFSRPEIELGPITLGILSFTIVGKAVASWYCRKVAREYGSASAEAYADDHRNDVLTNFVGVGAVVAAVKVPSLWFLDSTGAICIALYIIVNWLQTGFEQMHLLSGRGAPPMLLQQLTYIASHHDARIKFVDTVRAFHFGPLYLVEVDIVLPEDMPLRISHDIAESLQHRLEELEDIERAFVHCDYEWEHYPVVFQGGRIIRK